ncbi:hypothetical protein [Ralstonia phage RP12]|uniref:Uncharacterized protein n=1 Tax=Ralstonia phage RP12 TaxID=1923889 RepID=A0A1L7N0Z3_9CAUD|nr:hypothetical protein FDH28_gp244 [Ralstonia phage RP12]BAW19151.1 hypothetical protein [Ralstonia phage RP12]
MGQVSKVKEGIYSADIYDSNVLYSGRKLRLDKAIADAYFFSGRVYSGQVLGYIVVDPLTGWRTGLKIEAAAARVTEYAITGDSDVVTKITVHFEVLGTPMGLVLKRVLEEGHSVIFTGLFSTGIPSEGSDVHPVMNISGLIFESGK